MTLVVLEERIGHRFGDPALLRQALCHRSWVAENTGEASNERLEFLGDAVLGWVIADLVYGRFGDLAEGSLTDLRKSVVNAHALAEVATDVGLGPHLLLGRGEDAAGGRRKVSILSDAMEAVLGAVYLDAGVDVTFGLVERLFVPRLESAVGTLDRLDCKSSLQEALARMGLGAPVYAVTSTGPDHERSFRAIVSVDGSTVGTGEGRSKKAAEQAAAAAAVDRLADGN